jgi:glycosyltransferase involved in cell wall biosynthesis
MVLAEQLAAKGLEITVLCHKHEANLKDHEIINGVSIHRARPLFKINRATVSFDFFVKYFRLRKNKSYINLHLPMPEAGFLSIRKEQKLITTYQCDVPKNSLVMSIFALLMDISSRKTIRRSEAVVYSTLDYMSASRMRSHGLGKSLEIFPFSSNQRSVIPLFQNNKGRNFGYLGRFTSEKGAMFLIKAFRKAASQDDQLILAGSSKVAGDSVYEKVLLEAKSDSRILLLPDISEGDLPKFYASLSAFCFPSLNSFEAFGIAQVEAILAGVPVLSSDLPGVRIPVKITGMGQVLPVGDQAEWERAIRDFDRDLYPNSISEDEEKLFTTASSVKKYLDLFDQ